MKLLVLFKSIIIEMQTTYKRAAFATALLVAHATAEDISPRFLCDRLAAFG